MSRFHRSPLLEISYKFLRNLFVLKSDKTKASAHVLVEQVCDVKVHCGSGSIHVLPKLEGFLLIHSRPVYFVYLFTSHSLTHSLSLSLSSYISSGSIGALNLSTTGNITLGVVRGGQISLICNGAFLKAKVAALAPLYMVLHVCLWMHACT